MQEQFNRQNKLPAFITEEKGPLFLFGFFMFWVNPPRCSQRDFHAPLMQAKFPQTLRLAGHLELLAM